MQEHLDRREDEANKHLHPVQIKLRDNGDEPKYWVRPFIERGCLIFGHALSYEEACEASAKDVPARPDLCSRDVESAASYEEALGKGVSEIRSVLASRTRGYLYGMAWSVLAPQGEWGTTHVATAFPISEQAFTEAKTHGWRAIDADEATKALVPAGALAEKTTPTLVAELSALQAVDEQFADALRGQTLVTNLPTSPS